MQLYSHLRQSRHGVWHFRLLLPRPVAAAVGQREIKRSLYTRDIGAARLMAYALCGKILPVIRHLGRVMADDPNIDNGLTP